MVLASFAIEHGIFGEKPAVSHFFNVMFYVILVLALFSSLRHLFPEANILFPFAITLLFAAHPVHTEVVASIKNRDEILSLLGGILSLNYALRFGNSGKFKFMLLSFFFFIFGVLSKKSVIPFSFIAPLAVILFSKVSFRDIMLLTTGLAVTSSFFSPLHFIYEKIVFAFAVVLAVGVVYAIKNGLLEMKKNFTIPSKKATSETDLGTTPSAILPLSVPLQLLILGTPLILSTLGIFFDIDIVVFGGLLVFMPLIFLFEKKAVSWGILAGSIVIAYVSYVYNVHILASTAAVVFICVLLLYHKSSLIFAILSTLILFGAVCLVKGKLDQNTVFLFPIVYLYCIQKTRKIGLMLFAGALIAKIVGGVSPIHTAGPILIAAIFISINQFIGQSPKVRLTIAAISVLVIIGSSWSFFTTVSQWNGQVNKIAQEAEAPEFFPASSGRVLEFVEMPLNNQSPISQRIGTSFYVLGRYLWLTILPIQLSYYYGYKEIPLVDWSNYISLISIAVYLALGILALIWLRKKPRISFGIFVYLSCISFFSNLAAPVAGLMADRYLFGASLGFCIVLTVLLFKVLKVNPNAEKIVIGKLPMAFIAVFGVLLMAYSVRTVARNFTWKNHLTLFSHDIKHLEESAQAHNLLGIHLAKKGTAMTNNHVERTRMLSEAVHHFERAVEIEPGFMNAWFDLGRTSSVIGEYPKAIAAYKRVHEIDSTFYAPLVEIALIYDQQNMFERAIPFYRRVIEIDSTYMGAYTNLSMIYFKQNQYQKAIDVNKEALRVIPNAYEPTVNIGKTFYNMSENDSALFYFEKAYTLNQGEPMLLQTINELKRLEGIN